MHAIYFGHATVPVSSFKAVMLCLLFRSVTPHECSTLSHCNLIHIRAPPATATTAAPHAPTSHYQSRRNYHLPLGSIFRDVKGVSWPLCYGANMDCTTNASSNQHRHQTHALWPMMHLQSEQVVLLWSDVRICQ